MGQFPPRGSWKFQCSEELKGIQCGVATVNKRCNPQPLISQCLGMGIQVTLPLLWDSRPSFVLSHRRGGIKALGFVPAAP